MPGIIVFEPVAASGVADGAADEAAGWGDWLYLTVGGQPELGQTPMITSVFRAQREIKHTDNLRLGLEDARRIAKMTGANRVALGVLSSPQSPSVTLTYTIYDVETGQALGKPLTAAGSAESIRKQLTGMASEMAHRLGVASPNIPAQIEATGAELSAAGRTFWTSDASPADLETIKAASSRVPLASICQLKRDRNVFAERQNRQNLTNLLTNLAPANPLAWGYSAFIDTAGVVPLLPKLKALRQRYPQNYGLAHTAVWMSREVNDLPAEVRNIDDTLRNGPATPDSWLALGQTLRLQASKLRKGRFDGEISADEWKKLNSIYAVWERSVLHATELDPLHEDAWLRLATAATFQGDNALARKAYAKASEFTHRMDEVYLWGFQMFDPKWGGTSEEMNAVAARAVKENYTSVHDAIPIVSELKRLGFPDEARTLATRLLPLAEEKIKSTPDYSDVYSDKLLLLDSLDQAGSNRAESLAFSEAATHRLPNDVWVHINYARRLSTDHQQYPQSEAEYRTALRLESDNAEAMTGLAYVLTRSSSKEAEALLKQAITLKPEYAYAHAQLGFLYSSILRNKVDGIAEYERAVDLGQRDVLTITRLSRMLTDGGQADKAEPYALMAVHLFPKDVSSYNSLAYVFLMEKKIEEATRAGQMAFTISDIDTEAHINFGLIQNARGDRREARREWERVVASQAGKEQKERAQSYLTKYPEMKP